MLLDRGANPLANGRTAAHALAQASKHETLAELLRHPGAAALTRVADAVGMTPQHAALAMPAEPQAIKTAATLLQLGADGNAEDFYGRTAAKYCREQLEATGSARVRWADEPPRVSGGCVPSLRMAEVRFWRTLLRLLAWHRRRAALAACAWRRSQPAAYEQPVGVAAPSPAAELPATPAAGLSAPAGAGLPTMQPPPASAAAGAAAVSSEASPSLPVSGRLSSGALANTCDAGGAVQRAAPVFQPRPINDNATEAMWGAVVGDWDPISSASSGCSGCRRQCAR